MNNAATTAQTIATDLGLDTLLVDAVDPQRNCPGFSLFVGTVGDRSFLVTADDESSAQTRLFFRTNGQMTEFDSIEFHSVNPDVKAWSTLRDAR